VDHVAEALRACQDALEGDDLAGPAAWLTRRGLPPAAAAALVGTVTQDPASHTRVARLLADAPGGAHPPATHALARVLLLHAALDAIRRLPTYPVGPDVKRLLCDEYRFIAAPAAAEGRPFDVGSAGFTRLCKLVTMRLFPAGQFDWDVSGVSRSDVLNVGVRRLPATALFLARRMRGLQPVFFSHLNPRRPNRSLLESEANRSYYRMARSMQLQPHIKGFAACSWFRSPATHRVSPHLAWLSRVFEDNGGLVVESGRDRPDSGALGRSRTRRRLYEQGLFTPTRGLVLWPRDAMIAWAAAHPHLADADAG
jgi:hypothetical protein